VLNHAMILKSDELYFVGSSDNAGSGERSTGLYLRDTRYLDRCDVHLNGVPLNHLQVQVLGAATAGIVDANGAFSVPTDGELTEMVHPLTVSIEQTVRLDTDLQVEFVLRNFSGRTLPLTLSCELSADFRDLFDIRGFPRSTRGGSYLPPAVDVDRILLAYIDRAGDTAMTDIAFDPPPTLAVSCPPATVAESEMDVLLPGYDQVTPHLSLAPPPCAKAYFSTALASGDTWRLTMTISPVPPGERPVSAEAKLRDGERPRPALVTTDNVAFNRVLDRAASDLALLQTSFADGSLPAAGIPWFVAPFGRDSLIVGLQTVHLAPRRAAGTLRILAALQGEKVDPFREEEPGKILHEVRYGEMARLGEIPHTPYYGSIDSTPLFVLLFAETVAWTGDERLYAELLPNVQRALTWIEAFGDRDGDGLVEYLAHMADGVHIVHQGWKDSHDSLHHTDGRPATGAIALVEVQGYVYAAYQRLAEVAAIHDDLIWADQLRGRAAEIQRKVEETFWIEEDGYYAQALDGDKSPVRSISSNPGHLLFAGLPSPAHAAAVATRLGLPDIDSGWGIRTLSASMPTYNPMSYHNGSVWPHDNSLIVVGLRAYGHVEAANQIASALVAAAESDPLLRLPELYCGFARTEQAASRTPVAYPVSCSPQAWAAASSQLLVRAMLGLRIDLASGTLLVEPALPSWLDEMIVTDLCVRGRRVSLAVRRSGDGYDIETDAPVADAVAPAPVAIGFGDR